MIRIIPRLPAVFVSAAALASSVFAGGGDPSGTPFDLGELRALAAERSQRIQNLAISLDVFQDEHPADRRAWIPRVSRAIFVDAETGRFRMHREIERPVGGETPGSAVSEIAFDGQTQTALLPDEAIGVISEGTNLNGLVESGVWGMMMLAAPQPGGFGIDDGSLESLLARGTLRGELEWIDGVPCHVVDATRDGVRYATIWLDAERDLLPVRRVVYSADGNMASEVTVDDAVFVDDESTWLPASWQTRFRARGETFSTQTVVHAESIELNGPIEDSEFAIEFPPGTAVADQVSGITYRVSESGEPGEVLYVRSGEEWTPVGEESSDAAPPRSDAPPADSMFDLIARLADDFSRKPLREARQSAESSRGGPIVTATPGNAPSVAATAAESSQHALAPSAGGTPFRTPLPAVATNISWMKWALVFAALIATTGLLALLIRARSRSCDRAPRGAVRTAALPIALLAMLLLAIWRIGFYVPAAGTPLLLQPVEARAASTAAPAVPYELLEGEAIRHVPFPSSAARRELFERMGLLSEFKISEDCLVSVTVLWNGEPRHHRSQCGTRQFPRTLQSVLRSSLGVPAWRIEGLEVARQIVLEGDWVLRDPVDLDACMVYVEKVVRESGHPGFRIERAVQPWRGVRISGTARTPERPIVLHPPFGDVRPTHTTTGPLSWFADALSHAIQAPVALEATNPEIEVAWQDHSHAYVDLSRPITPDMIARVLSETAASLSVQVVDGGDVPMTIWRLSLPR